MSPIKHPAFNAVAVDALRDRFTKISQGDFQTCLNKVSLISSELGLNLNPWLPKREPETIERIADLFYVAICDKPSLFRVFMEVTSPANDRLHSFFSFREEAVIYFQRIGGLDKGNPDAVLCINSFCYYYHVDVGDVCDIKTATEALLKLAMMEPMLWDLFKQCIS